MSNENLYFIVAVFNVVFVIALIVAILFAISAVVGSFICRRVRELEYKKAVISILTRKENTALNDFVRSIENAYIVYCRGSVFLARKKKYVMNAIIVYELNCGKYKKYAGEIQAATEVSARLEEVNSLSESSILISGKIEENIKHFSKKSKINQADIEKFASNVRREIVSLEKHHEGRLFEKDVSIADLKNENLVLQKKRRYSFIFGLFGLVSSVITILSLVFRSLDF